METLELLELFGGIGACSMALKELGIPYHIADYVEIDKYAVKSYNAIHGTNFEPQDICTWDKDIKVDLIMHGSPCQDISAAGQGRGADKDSGTRSSLMYETLRIVEKLKPKYVIWENVKNLLSKAHRHNFDSYLESMEQLGYKNYYQVLNAKDYGIPQNRERVFTVSIRKDVDKGFTFPIPKELQKYVPEFLEQEVDEKFYLSQKNIEYVLDMKGVALKNGRNIENRIINPLIAKTISCRGAADQRADITNFVIENVTKEIRVSEFKERSLHNLFRVRKLIPLECWRLMAFPDNAFYKAKEAGVSDTQLYKQAGNSIPVNLIFSVLANLLLT